ncbi:preprotein translocase subunit SecA [Patescibacteria group bacterium]|nr:preprotein translocase subunit SecA [Patescibacteria group bacterium]
MPNPLDRFLGDTSAAYLRRHQKTLEKINSLEPELQKLSDAALKAKTAEFKARLTDRIRQKEHDPLSLLEVNQRANEKKEVNAALEALLPEAFAVAREAAVRTVGQRHFDVQMLGGIVLHYGNIAEMRTGEGKTLVATLPLYLNSLLGRGSHLITVNDYLAKLAVELYGPVYDFLGLSVGVIVHDTQFRYENGELVPVSRREAYGCDITYGTNNEFGFDYLRDNMAQSLDQMVQRELFYAIVDEVDSILIDEARTPLIISGPAEESADLYMRFSQLVPRLRPDEDYTVDEKDRVVTLTREGIAKMEQLLGVENIYTGEEMQLAYHLEEALKAHILFKRDKDYVVREGEVIIVDEFTGRLMPGRRYSEGLHQAIEAKEGVKVQRESDTLATISFQNLFRLYTKLAGMTGTAKTEEEEFIKIYDLEVIVIPTNKPMIRQDLSDRIYKTESGKYQALIADVKERHQKGQPILIGTISIEKNEHLGQLLKRNGVPHEVLNAKNHEREAHIVAQAGRRGSVTLATNLAGRGTDIMLGGVEPRKDDFESEKEYEKAHSTWERDHAEVVSLGGLHVLGTERHESRRIDNQLRGRSGRQGDPGSSQFYISTEDDLMRIFGGERMKHWLDVMGVPDDEAIEHKMISRTIESAQKKVEGHNFDIRKRLVQFDDVMNRHREVIYSRRRKALQEDGLAEVEQAMESAIGLESRRLAATHASGHPTQWNLDQLVRDVATTLGLAEQAARALHGNLITFQSDAAVEERLRDLFTEVYGAKKQEFGEVFPAVLRTVYLRTIDVLWVEHLNTMQELRTGIGLQGYAQTDPLVAYKSEGYRLFQQLLVAVEEQLMRTMFRVEKVEAPPTPPAEAAPARVGG